MINEKYTNLSEGRHEAIVKSLTPLSAMATPARCRNYIEFAPLFSIHELPNTFFFFLSKETPAKCSWLSPSRVWGAHINDKHLPAKTLIKKSWLAFPHGFCNLISLTYQSLDVLQALVSYIKETAQYPSQCLWIHQWLWASWGFILTIRWLYYFLAACCSDSWEKVELVIRKVFPYHQAPKDSRLSVTCLICHSTSHGLFTKNGVRLTVSFL